MEREILLQQTALFFKAAKGERRAVYEIGEIVLYGKNGVCKIQDIAARDFGGTTATYYVLKPVFSDGSTIFVPAENQELIGKMKRVLSRDEICTLIQSIPQEETIWIDDENERKQRYQEILLSNDEADLLKLVKTLRLKRKDFAAQGKKLHAIDERFMTEAEELLLDEFALVLEKDREDILPLIMRQVQMT